MFSLSHPIVYLRHSCLSVILTVISFFNISAAAVKSQSVDRLNKNQTIVELSTCPSDVETLTTLLLKDLPSYANRVIQRTQKLNRDAGFDSYVVLAGRAEFEPLNLPQINYNPNDSEPPQQVFFTTLERHYYQNQKREIQTYHWLFLTETDSGWRMVTMFSRFGGSAQEYPPTPPQESSNGIIGQAVNLWLRDCRSKITN
jgi:hypothetical protein